MATETAVLDNVRTVRVSTRQPGPKSPAATRVEVTLLGGFGVRGAGSTISASH